MTVIKEFQDKLYCDAAGAATGAVAGKDVWLCIFNATGEKLLAVAMQNSLKINREKDIIDIDAKTIDGGWKTKVAGIKDWSIEVEGVYSPDESLKEIKKAFNDDTYLCIKVINNKAKKPLLGGLTLVKSIKDEAPNDDSVTYSIALEGCGKLVDFDVDSEKAATATQMVGEGA